MDIFIKIIAIPLLFFIPGFVVSFLFFKKGNIDLIERLALSFFLSITIIPFIVFYTNIIGLPVTAITIMLQIFWLLLAVGIVLQVQRHRHTK